MKLGQVGYFSRTHGIKGELVLREENVLLDTSANALFIEGPSGMAPYFITSVKQGKNGLIIALEDISDEQLAKKLVGKRVYADEKFIEEEEDTAELVGYSLYADGKLLGAINAIDDNGAQLIATITYNGKDVMLPLADELIEKLDDANKRIDYKLPGGLLEI